jgi:transcriptional regulator with XRE-family HTH domain
MSSDTDTTFKQRLIDKRNERGLNQSELARKAGMQPSAIAHFEAGRRKPSFANIRALAVALNTTADYLLGADGSGVTAFRDEDKLSAADRAFIQGIIDMRVKDKPED